MKQLLTRRNLYPAITGFLLGALASTLYLLAGGEEGYGFDAVPRWAFIVFFPGFLAGNAFYEYVTSDLTLAKVIGVIAVGISYAVFAVLITALCRFLLGRRRRGTE